MSKSRHRNKPPKPMTVMTAKDANYKRRAALRTSADGFTLAHLKQNLARLVRPVRRRRIAAQPEQQEA